MERAALKCTKTILGHHLFSTATIFCGPGNNGGDGLVIARLLQKHGITVHVYLLDLGSKQSEEFKTNLHRLPKKIPVSSFTAENHNVNIKKGLIIDAIFGIGLNKEISGWLGELISTINLSGNKIVSIDIPSGLFADDNRNHSLKNVIKANETLTFQIPKMAFFYPKYEGYIGKFYILDIGLNSNFSQKGFANFILKKDLCLNSRNTFDHKGKSGYLLNISGFDEYYGAPILSSKAAFRTGCGYVATHCNEESKLILIHTLPECLFVKSINSKLPEKASAIAIGCGIGTSGEAKKKLIRVLKSNLPIVIDADAINILSSNTELLKLIPANTILTPHQKELERLIGKSNSPELQLEKQIAFSKKYKLFILQKGAFSKLTTPSGEIYINSSGNPGMASAGMGDVLTGIIGSFLAQGYAPLEAAKNGMFIHGYCADLIRIKKGERGMLASDLIEILPEALNQF